MSADAWWIRYGGKRTYVFPVERDHETWLRADGGRNAERLGLPRGFMDRHGEMTGDELVVTAMQTTTGMMVRGCGNHVVIRYWNERDLDAFKSIVRWGKNRNVRAGSVLLLAITNVRTGQRFLPMFLVLADAVKNGRPVQAWEGCKR